MKKILFMLLSTICVIALSSCDGTKYKKNEWFAADKLEQCEISNLPTVTCSDYYYNNKDWVYFNVSGQELEEYAKVVYEYLESQNFEYLGTRGHQKASLAGAFASYYFKEIESFDDCHTQSYGKDYIFIYSNGKVDENGQMVFNEIIIADFDNQTIRYDGKDIYCNAKIQIKYDAYYYFEECEDDNHVWEEKEYDLASGIYKRCSICGKMELVEEKND